MTEKTQIHDTFIDVQIYYHSFTLSRHAQNLPFQQILPTLDFFYLDCLMITGLNRGPITLIIIARQQFCPSLCLFVPVMYTVLSSLDACGCLGVAAAAAAAAGVFVCHA